MMPASENREPIKTVCKRSIFRDAFAITNKALLQAFDRGEDQAGRFCAATVALTMEYGLLLREYQKAIERITELETILNGPPS